MSKILDTLNNLLIKWEGGLVIVWGAIIYFIVKFFKFLGGCMAEGAINKVIAKIISIVRSEFKVEFDSMKKDNLEIKEALKIKINQKHGAEGQLRTIVRAILDDDKETIKEIKNYYKSEENKN